MKSGVARGAGWHGRRRADAAVGSGGREPRPVSAFAGAAAGPFTVHFWAPMSKWLISGASMMELIGPSRRCSLAQYTALTLTGAFFSRCNTR